MGVQEGTHDCALCAAAARAPEPVDPADRREDLFPWALGAFVAVLFALAGQGWERWIGLGATFGLVCGGWFAWHSIGARARALRKGHEREVRALHDDADARVAMVVRQFEWAVNDVVALKASLGRANSAIGALEDRSFARERYVERLERSLYEARERIAELAEPAPAAPRFEIGDDDVQEETVTLRWALHDDGQVRWLELDVAMMPPPSRLRLLEDGDVIATSGPAVPITSDSGAAADGSAYQFALAVPDDLVAELESGGPGRFAVEARIHLEWRPARLEDSGRRTRVVRDKAGRFYRLTERSPATARELLVARRVEVPSANPPA